MKKFIVLMMIVLMMTIVIPVIAQTAENMEIDNTPASKLATPLQEGNANIWEDIWNVVLPNLLGLAASVISILLLRWFKIYIEDKKIERILFKIFDIEQDIDNDTRTNNLENHAKKELAIELVRKKLPKKDLSFLDKVYKGAGGISTAIEAAMFMKKNLKGVKKLFS